MAYQTGSTGFGVNLSLIEGEFTPTWDYVFDSESAQQLLGRVSLMAESRETMGAALRYLGHSSSTTSEGELAAASRLVEDSLGQISVFQATNARDLVNGDLALAHGRSGDFAREFSTLDDSSGFRFVVPLEGGTVWVESLAIPKAARDVCSAHAFINFLMSPENATALAEWSYYATPNQAAFRRLPPEIAEDPIIYPQEETLALLERLLYTGTFETRYNETFAATMP